MKEYKYKIYNPKVQNLKDVLEVEPIESDWEFLKVVVVTDYEWVAVFEKHNI